MGDGFMSDVLRDFLSKACEYTDTEYSLLPTRQNGTSTFS